VTHHDDEERSDERADLTAERAALHRRLLEDGAAWRTSVPANDRLNARVRALPGAMPAPGMREALDPMTRAATRTTIGTRGGLDEMIQAPTRTRKVGVWAAGVAAVLVVGLLGVVFASLARSHSPGATGPGSGGGTPTPTPGPMATPLPGAKYVVSAVTARSVDAHFNPVDPTGFFKPGNAVYVVLQVRNVPAGQHHVSIKWYLDGQDLQLPPNALSSKTVTQDSNAYFGLTYPQAGRGTARIYWDLPAGTSDPQSDAWLAQVVAFTVTTQDAPPPTPTPAPPLTPAPTPHQTATPAPGPTPTPPR